MWRTTCTGCAANSKRLQRRQVVECDCPRSSKRTPTSRHGFALLALDILARTVLADHFPARALDLEVAAVTTIAAAGTRTTRASSAPISARIAVEDAMALRSIAERNHSTVSRLVAVCVAQGLPALAGRSAAHEQTERTVAAA